MKHTLEQTKAELDRLYTTVNQLKQEKEELIQQVNNFLFIIKSRLKVQRRKMVIQKNWSMN
mgnify:CR=1 FL=1